MAVHYQQVMDNLAMLCLNPDAIPSFSVAGSGTAQISDNANVAGGILFNPVDNVDLGGSIGVGGSRQISEQWNLTPVLDPDKLRAMQCICWLALGRIDKNFVLVSEKGGVPVCNIRNDEGEKPCDVLMSFIDDKQIDRIFDQRASDWLHGPVNKNSVPRHACFVACHCDQYFWVDANGMFGLSELTEAILSIATQEDAMQVGQFQVTKDDGDDQKTRVTMTIPIDGQMQKAGICRAMKLLEQIDFEGTQTALSELTTGMQALSKVDIGKNAEKNSHQVSSKVGAIKDDLEKHDLTSAEAKIDGLLADIDGHRTWVRRTMRTLDLTHHLANNEEAAANLPILAAAHDAANDATASKLVMARTAISESRNVAASRRVRTRTRYNVPSVGLQFVPRR